MALLIVAPIIFWILDWKDPRGDWDLWKSGASFLSGFLLFIAIITATGNYYTVKSQIQIYKTNTVFMRGTENNFKSAATITKAVEYNEWLINNQNWNKVFDLWIPDEVNNLKPIIF
jgi:hypothetical protein